MLLALEIFGGFLISVTEMEGVSDCVFNKKIIRMLYYFETQYHKYFVQVIKTLQYPLYSYISNILTKMRF